MSSDTLTAKQIKAIEALLTKPTVTEAAKAAGVARRTLHDWLSNDALFKTKLDDAQTSLLQQQTARLAGLMESATGVYKELLDSEDDAVRLRAADAIHKSFDTLTARRLVIKEAQEFEERLGQLEQLYATQKT